MNRSPPDSEKRAIPLDDRSLDVRGPQIDGKNRHRYGFAAEGPL
jgi:hypothetical protein